MILIMSVKTIYSQASSLFSSSFFGFPCTVTVTRDAYSSQAKVQIEFPEGYQPHGCKMYLVRDVVNRLFLTKAKIEPDDERNRFIKFLWDAPYVSGPNGMTSDMASGMAAAIFAILIAHVEREQESEDD